MAPGGLVTGYQILRRYVPSPGYGVFRVIATTGPTATTYEDESVGFGGRYIFRVKAMYGDVLSPWSKLARAYVPEPPAAPEGLVAMEGDGMVTLTWNDPGDNTLTGYEVRYGESGTDLPAWSADHDIDSDAGTTTHPVPGLTNGIEYTIEVRGVAGDYPGASSSVMATPGAVPPPPPGNLTAREDDRAVTLTWDNLDTPDVTGYEIRYGVGEAPAAWTVISVSPVSDASTMTHPVPGLTNGIVYTFEVRAKAGDDEGASSSVTATPVPAKPANFRAASGNRKVTLTWSDPRDDAVSGYQLRYARSTLALPDWSEIADSGPNTRRHAVTGLTNGIEYTFEVRAKAGIVHGDSARATATPRQETVTPPPPPPCLAPGAVSNLNATAGVGQVALSWTNPSGTIIDNHVRYKVSDTPLWSTWTSIGETTTHTVQGLDVCEEYTFQVRAKNDCPNNSVGDADIATATTTGSVPGAVTGLSGEAGVTQVELSWTNPSGMITENRVRYAKSTVDLPENWTGIGLTTSHTVPNLNAGTEYTFEVLAWNPCGEGDSMSKTVTILDEIRDLTITCPADQTVKEGADISLTATASGGTTPYTFDPLSISPSKLTLGISTQPSNDGDRTISGTATPAGEYNVEVTVEDAPDSKATCSFEITVCEPVVIDPISNKTVPVNTRITITPRATGGCGSIEWSMTGAPGDVTIDRNTGVIGGSVGDDVREYNVRVTATDMANRNNTDYEDFRITVDPPPCDQIVIDPISNVTVTVGDDISITPSVQVNCQITYTMSGRLPPGVRFNSATGVISGTVGGSPDTYDVTVTATAEDNSGNTDDEDFTITVECPDITVTQSPDPVEVKAGGTATVTVSAEGGCGTKTFGNPGGLGWVRKTASDQYTVEPPSGTAPGPYTFGVTATDAEGNTGPGTINVTVACPDISVGGLSNVEVEVRQNIPSMTADASGGQSRYRYTMSGAPGTVRIDPTTGVISGRAPNTDGTYLVTVKATDAGGCWGTTPFEIRVVVPPLEIDAIRDVEATVGQAMPARAASASGGETPYVFTMSGKPSWVSFNASSGRISGTPTSTGTSTATVTVTDKKGVTDTTPSFQLRVSAPLTIASISDVVVTWQLDMDPIQVSASGGRSPYVHSLESAPAGITINESTGLITGTPTQLGSAIVTVIVRDQEQRQEEEPFTMTVALPGDFNGDVRRDAKDAALLNRKFGLRSSDAGYDRRMDLNKDGTINMADLVILTGYIESDAAARGGSGSGDSGTSGG